MVPGLFAIAFVALAVPLRKDRYQSLLSVLAALLLPVFVVLPPDPFPGSQSIPAAVGWLVGLFLPDALMPSVQAWLDSNPIAVIAAVVGFSSLWYLRKRFKQETERRFEKACDLIRSGQGDAKTGAA